MAKFNRDSDGKALSYRKSNPFGCTVGCFPVLLFFAGIVCVFVTVVIAGDSTWPYIRSQWFKEVPCQIVKNELSPKRKLLVEFEYEWNNRKYTSNIYDYMRFSAVPKDVAATFPAKFPPGTKTTCYLDTKRLTPAILRRDFRMEVVWGFFPIVFFLIFAMVASIMKSVFLSRFSSRLPQTDGEDFLNNSELAKQFAVAFSDKIEWRDTEAQSGPQELKPTGSPLGMFLGSLAFTGFWSGIVSLFVVDVVNKWLNGKGDWLETLFMMPFVLVGIGGIGVTIYLFLKLFNPTPKVAVSECSIPLGNSFLMKWVIEGRQGRIRNLKIRLKGNVWIQYRQGTSTYTEEELFCDNVLVDVNDPIDIETGDVEVQIPADSMHSFEASSNKVKWNIEVHGDVPFWPDVHFKFPINVLPVDVGQHSASSGVES